MKQFVESLLPGPSKNLSSGLDWIVWSTCHSSAPIILRLTEVATLADVASSYIACTLIQGYYLNEQVRRSTDRFPGDFMFQLTQEEARALRSQFATLKTLIEAIRQLMIPP